MSQAAPPAVVLNLEYTGLGIARSLGRRGIPVIGLMNSPRQCGRLTRFSSARNSPSARTNPRELLACLLDLVKEIGKGAVLLPTSDADVLLITRNWETLSACFAAPLPGPEVVETVMNKAALCEKARECGVPVPGTARCDTLEAVCAAGAAMSYPFLVKPVYAYVWRQGNNWSLVGRSKAIKVSSLRELVESYLLVSCADRSVLVQEFVPGGDDQIFIAGVYILQNGDFGGAFTARKLLQEPEETGTGVLVESVDAPEVLSLAVRLLHHLGYRGIAEVEFKRNPSTGTYHLIEINPRFWDWHRLGAAAGIDLSYMAYQDLTGGKVSPVRPQKHGICWIAGRGLFRCVMRKLLKRRTVSGLSVLWRVPLGVRESAVFSWDDPRPAFSTIRKK